MKQFLLSLGLILSILSCKKEINENIDVTEDNIMLATPVPKENKITETKIIDSESFNGASFQAKLPKGFTAKPSIGTGYDFNEYDSYYFISPDELVQFYAYASATKNKPNDIIFPNENIEKKVTQRGDTLITQWQLPINKQTGFIRKFTEKSFNNGVLITGYYFKDTSAYEKYLTDFETFYNTIQHKTK